VANSFELENYQPEILKKLHAVPYNDDFAFTGQVQWACNLEAAAVGTLIIPTLTKYAVVY
jgi:hypothetical protein